MPKNKKSLLSVDKRRQRMKMQKVASDSERLKAVNQTQLLDTPADVAFDRLTHLASKLLNTPVSFVTLLEKDRDFIKSQFGLPEPIASQREIRAHPSFCQHIISQGEPLILEDARDNPLFNDFPSVTQMGVVAYAGIPLVTPEGKALGTCCVLDFKPRKWTKDEIEILTELASSVMTEINLRTVAAQLQRELEYKDAFIGIASHELKTPITSLKAHTQILQKKVAADGNKEVLNCLAKIDNQLSKLNILVSDLLDVTKIERGQLQLEKKTFNLVELTQELIEDIQKISEKHTIIFEENDIVMLRADRERIGQVISNLIANAIKYSPKGDKVIVTITQQVGSIRMSVQDFGVGIEIDSSSKIFERFYRVTGSSEHTFPGLGLGLYISKEIIKRHNGEIWVESIIGRGSTFFFSLPNEK